ncbi:MAG: hypothetical protein IMZ58_08495 [Thermoplasmata archaeon]|nr:hypothetical protein [Thermoplasmata archaeon]
MNIKYLFNGQAVNVCEKVESGFLVQDVYDADDETMVDERIYLVDIVYDNAPTVKMDERIAELDKKIENLEQRRSELNRQIVEINKTEKTRIDKYKKYEQLKNLDAFIDGKITHLLMTDYRIEIIEWGSKESKCDYDHKDLKLCVLFGCSNGNLEWRINAYHDGSGSYKTFVPCCSYEEAVQKAQEYVDLCSKEEKKSSYMAGNLIEAAKKYPITIPKEMSEWYYKETGINLNKQLVEIQCSLDKKRSEIKQLTEIVF